MKLRLLASLALIIFLAGCGLTHQEIVKTQSFGAATEAIGKIGVEEFVNIRNSIIEMNTELITIDTTRTTTSLSLDKPTNSEATAQRVTASRALKLYGELLVKLSTEDRTPGLQKAANSFVENTSAALGTQMTDAQKGAIRNIVVGLGSFLIEKKKADAVREIVPAFAKPVDDLANLLMEDFSLDNGALGYLKAYDVTARRLKNASIKRVNSGDKYSYSERDRAVEAYILAEKALIRAKALSEKATESIEGLKKANRELVNVINKRAYSTDDIRYYVKRIQELVNLYRVLAR